MLVSFHTKVFSGINDFVRNLLTFIFLSTSQKMMFIFFCFYWLWFLVNIFGGMKYFVWEMQSNTFSINSTYKNVIVDYYINLTAEEKHRYCDVEALGNLIMNTGDKATDHGKRLQVITWKAFLLVSLLILRIWRLQRYFSSLFLALQVNQEWCYSCS